MNRRVMVGMMRIQNLVFSLTGGRGMGMPLLRLTTTGRSSGAPRSVLLLYLDDARGPIVIASAAGADDDPQWWKNLQANSNATLQSAQHGTIAVTASELDGDDREQTWQRLVSERPVYGRYQQQTERRIPLVALSPAE
ncbi:MAG: nitroreductase family deazaflavin-dependent oxidoreductase [Chloroflexota bacterium]|nr:nitroreductase family deazaflavin-dependent oxidoreductase [Chloroflexota bacterium]